MKDETKRDFDDFLKNQMSPPAPLREKVKKEITLSLSKRTIILKFLSFQALGALVTLTFCPQFGIGFIDGHGISHFFRMFGEWACAAFCGSLFLSSGTIFASFAMNQDEVYWIWDRYKYPFIIVPTFSWMFLMTLNLSFKLPGESMTYNMIWIISAILGQQLLLKFKSLRYAGVLITRK